MLIHGATKSEAVIFGQPTHTLTNEVLIDHSSHFAIVKDVLRCASPPCAIKTEVPYTAPLNLILSTFFSSTKILGG